MPEIPRKIKRLLHEHASRAWEAEMKMAIGSLAAKFDAWKAGAMSSSDLHDAIHEYHDGAGREIWKRFSTNDPRTPLAHAVAVGLIGKESLPSEVLEHIASMVEYFEGQERRE